MSEFNWVKERQKCSAVAIFERLRNEVEQDVEIRNGLRGPLPLYSYHFSSTTTAFTVTLEETNQPHRTARFFLEDEVISVEVNEQSMRATVTLNDAGECTLKIGNNEIGFWQFRKRALEKLFFLDARPNPA